MKQRPYKPVQLIAPHAPDCIAATHEDCWCMPQMSYGWGPDPLRRDLTGRTHPNAGHSWLVFRCQDAQCGAQMAVYFPHVISRIFGGETK